MGSVPKTAETGEQATAMAKRWGFDSRYKVCGLYGLSLHQFLYVCMYVCNECMYVTYVSMSRMYVCTYVRMYICTCVRM